MPRFLPGAALSSAPDGSTSFRRVLVWDLPTRLFHWALVLAIAGCWWTGERGQMETHALLGYAVLALLIFRLAWGLVGSETARFASFVRGPGAAASHLRSLLRHGALDRPVGHNAAGAYAVLLLLGALALLSASGLFLYDEEMYWAPLNGWVSGDSAKWLGWLHDASFDLLLVLAAIHVGAVALYFLLGRLDLLGPMLTGRAALPPDAIVPRTAPLGLALLVAAISVLAVWALITYGPGLVSAPA